MSITVSDAAFARVREIQAVEGPSKALRVSVLGGGCSGFQYRFDMDEAAADGDLVLEQSGARVLIDAVSQPFLKDAQVDFADELIGAHFIIRNPNAASSCGCGTSFSI